MAREGLLFALRAGLDEAKRGGKPVRKTGLRVKHDGEIVELRLEVLPLEVGAGEKHYMVLFEEVGELPAGKESRQVKGRGKKKEVKVSREEKRMERLEQELAASREYLQSIIQDLEAANEELQSANEEILSSNEELQSTNEELDTAKEELQSTNEELNTVNDELHGRNEEMSEVNSDLLNLLASVHIAIVMVSRDLRIRRFTPMAEKVLNLISGDLGRRISDIKPNIDCPDLEKLIGESVDGVVTVEREVKDRQGNAYSLRVRPYKNLENRIDGAVLALFEVEPLRRQEMETRQAKELSEAMLESMRQAMAILDQDFRVMRQNSAFARRFGSTDGDGKSIFEVMDGDADAAKLRSLLEDVLPRDGYVETFDLTNVENRPLRATARRLLRGGPLSAATLLALE
jgi:two-component system, chemotaxis family, CheB/CheR fusion protein